MIDLWDLYHQEKIEEWNTNIQDEIKEELKSYIQIGPSIIKLNINLLSITNKNLKLFLRILKQWIRLNELTFNVQETDQRISQSIIDTIAKHNKWLSLIKVNVNTEGTEFHNFAQISIDRNLEIRFLGII